MENLIQSIQINDISNNITYQENNSFLYKTLEVIYKRLFSKKLCFISGYEYDEITQTKSNSIEIRLVDNILIKSIKIGDIIKAKGMYLPDKVKPNEIYFHCVDYELIKKQQFKNNQREEFLNSEIKDSNNRTLCKNLRNEKECLDSKCVFRHYYFPNENEKLQILKTRQIEMYSLTHEGDTLSINEKKKKSLRHLFFVEFLVKTYGIDYLRSGPVLDIAGGKGLISFYLKTLYNIESIIIDLRGAILPKDKLKQLKKNNIIIKERRCMFDKNFDNELINSSSLLVGMHPDEATEIIVDVAQTYNKKFAIVPCCVFPKLFTHRFLLNGEFVSDFPKFIKYLVEKEKMVKSYFLNFEGRNRVLFTDHKILDK